MTRLLKFILGFLLLAVLLVGLVALLVPYLLDAGRVRAELVSQVKQATGRDLHIEGEIGLSVFPWLGVHLGAVSIGQPQGFGDGPFAAVREVNIRAKLLPLLRRHLEVDTVTLTGLRLNLARDARGHGNWEDLSEGGREAAVPTGAEPQAGAHQGGGLRGIAVGGLDIRDASVSWDDRRARQHLVVKDLSLATGRLVPGSPVDLKLAFRVSQPTPAMSARVSLATRLQVGAGLQSVDLHPFQLRLDGLRGAGGLSGEAELRAAIAYDAAAGRLRLDDLEVGERLAGGPLGEVETDSRVEGRVLADLKTQSYRIEGLRLTTRLAGGQISGGPLDAELGGAITLDLAKQLLGVQGLDLKGPGVHLTGDLQATRILSAPVLRGRLALAQMSPRGLLQRLGIGVPATADPAVLGRLAVSAELETGPRQLVLNNLKVALDDSNLAGSARVLLAGGRPGYRFALKLDGIDVDRYLPAAAAGPATTGVSPAAGIAGPPRPLFPTGPLRALDLDGSIGMGRLAAGGLKLGDIHLHISGKDGALTLRDKVGRFYGGSLDGHIGVNVREAVPRLDLAQHLKGVEAQPLVKDLAGQDRLAGTGALNLDLSADGDTPGALKRTLNGRLDFSFRDGAVKGFNLGRLLREAAAAFKGQRLPPDQEQDQTDFTELSGSAVVTDGVLRNDDLSAKSPLFRVTGAGSLDLAHDTLSYKIKPVLVASLKGQGGEDLDRLRGIPIPIRFKGPMTHPDWSIELAEALTESQKAGLKQKLDQELRRRLPKGLQELPEGLLKGLLH
jgi:AsmA protein